MPQTRPNRTLGPRHDEFWAGCANGELRLQRCAACGVVAWPVTSACEECGSPDLVFETLSGRGTMTSWCTFHYDYYRGVLPLPHDTVLVELEEGPQFISNPFNLDPKDMKVGMPVKVNFIDCEDAGGVFRLPVFERA